MTPEILIVGDPALRRDLIAKVRDCGYDVTLCLPKQIEERLTQPSIPAAVIVCMEDVQAALLLATLRRGRVGAMLPVILYVSTEHANQGLADVIDLGADHVVEDPIDAELLRRALLELAGNPAGNPGGSSAGYSVVSPDASAMGGRGFDSAHQVNSKKGRGHRLPPRDQQTDLSHREHEIGKPKSAKTRYREIAQDDSDAWEVDAMGLDSIPDVEPEGDPIDADESHSQLRLGSDSRMVGSQRTVSQWNPADSEDTEHRVWQPPTLEQQHIDSADSHSEVSETNPSSLQGRGESLPGTSPASDRANILGHSSTSVAGNEAIRRNQLDESQRAIRGYSPIEATQPIDHLHDATDELGLRAKNREVAPLANQVGTTACKTMSGQVGTIELARVFWRLAQSRFNGILKVHSEGGLRTLQWNLGQIYSVSSSFPNDAIENQLLRSGVLTREQLEQVQIPEGTEPDVILGELMRSGLIKASESGLLFGDYVLNIAYRVLAQCEGNWEQIEYAAPKSRRKANGFDIDLVIFQGVRLQLELNEIRRRLASCSITPRRITIEPALHEELARWSERYELSREEVNWIRHFDGKRNLEQLLALGGDAHQLWTLIYSFHVMERIELPLDEPEETANPVAIDGERILNRLRLAREADYFEFLGIDLDASQSDIRSSYASLSKTFSDEQLEQQSREVYASQLRELRLALREAHDILLDEVLRQAYAAHIGER